MPLYEVSGIQNKAHLISHVKQGSSYLQVQLPVGLASLEENGAKQWKTSDFFLTRLFLFAPSLSYLCSSGPAFSPV